MADFLTERKSDSIAIGVEFSAFNTSRTMIPVKDSSYFFFTHPNPLILHSHLQLELVQIYTCFHNLCCYNYLAFSGKLYRVSEHIL